MAISVLEDTEIENSEKALKMESPFLWLAIYSHKTHKGMPLTFEHYRYLRSLYEDKSDYIVVQKSTQCGISEYLVVRSIYSAMEGRSIFYVLPTDDIKNTYVKDRFDRTIEHTAFYKEILEINPKKLSESTSLKHIAGGAISFVGSNSARKFFSFPADEVIIDELDQCDQSNVEISDERLSASKYRRIIKVSNPTTYNYGINREFKESDQKHWHILCEHCGKWIEPDFFRHVVKEVEENEFVLLDNEYEENSGEDIKMICDCGKPLNRFSKGQWIPKNQRMVKSGYYISKLFSTNVKIIELVNKFEKGLKNDTVMERFYNGDLGIPYISSGSKLFFDNLDQCKREYNMPRGSKSVCVAGIDVGSRLHIVIGQILPDNLIRIVYIGEQDTEKQIYELAARFNVKYGCIDALPETRLSKAVARRMKGFFMVYFTPGVETVNIEHKTIKVNRTESMDAVKEAYLAQNILLPQNADKIHPTQSNGYSDYYNHLNAPTRLFDEKRNLYIWEEANNPDHYFLANTYMLIAKRIALKAYSNKGKSNAEQVIGNKENNELTEA